MATIQYNPDRGFRSWHISEVYIGPTGTGLIVPNINDLIVDYNNGLLRVSDVSPAPGYIPLMVQWDPTQVTASMSGDINYQPSASERAFYDSVSDPKTITIDDRYISNGSDGIVAKLFLGTDTSPNTGKVISLELDVGGNVIGENVPLELVENNPVRKRPSVIPVATNLLAGETVTLAIYRADGGISGVHTFIVTDSTAIRSIGAATNAITGITIVTSMLAADTIEVPINVSISGLDFTALLHYANGSTASIPIDGVKCKLHGINSFNTSLPGVPGTVVLSYYPDPTEPAINVSGGAVSSAYPIVVKPNALNNGFKIYISPKYNVTTGQYVNTYWLTNLDYDLLLELDPALLTITMPLGATPNYTPNSGVQELTLSLVMSDVFSVGYTNYTFVQRVKISYGNADNVSTAWTIDYVGNQFEVYGIGTRFGFSNLGTYPMQLISGELSVANWLTKLYSTIYPIYDNNTANVVRTPTHFRLNYEGITGPDIPVNDWQLYQDSLNGVAWTDLSTVNVIWLYDDSANGKGMLILGLSPVMIHPSLI